MINWAEAGRVAGIGFGVVFLVLFILALSIKVMGLVILFLGIEPRDKRPDQEQNKK